MPESDFTAYDLFMKSVNSSHNIQQAAAQSPQYMIEAGDIFASNATEGPLGNASPCMWIETGSARLATHDCSGELTGDGRVVANDTVVCMRYGSWAPAIQLHMWEGIHLEAIKIYRIMKVGQTNQIIQTLTHSTCYFKTYEQNCDLIKFTFGFSKFEDDNIFFNHNGEKAGHIATSHNFESLEATTDAG